MNPFTFENPAFARWSAFQPNATAGPAKVRVAVVGLGAQGSKLAKATLDAGFELVAVCDSNPARLKEFQAGGKTPKVTGIDDLQGLGVDVCVLATLADSHFRLIQLLFEAGIHKVLCEKPVVNQTHDLAALWAFLGSSKMRVLVNHIKLWSEDLILAKAIIRAEGMGALERVSVRFKSAGFGNIGCHQLASLCYLTGKRFTSVKNAHFSESARPSRKKGHSDPNGSAFFDLSGVAVDVDNRSAPLNPPNRISFYFERGIFEVMEEANLLRHVDFMTGADRHQFFKLPWFGSRASWSVLVHLLREAILELAERPEPAKLEVAFQAAEAIIGAQKCFMDGGPVTFPLSPAVKTPFLFS